jgi:cardiolipin synthase
MTERQPSVPGSWRHLPNAITLLRIALILPIALALLHAAYLTALCLLGLAAVSDAADGFLAKHFGWQTDLGAWLDPAADKLLLATLFVLLAIEGGVPVWLMVLAVGRDVLLVTGAVAVSAAFGGFDIRPSAISKLNTLAELVLLAALVSRAKFAWPPEWLITCAGGLVVVTIVVSGLDYALRFASHPSLGRRGAPVAAGSAQGSS